MKLSQITLIVLLSAVVAFASVKLMAPTNPAQKQKETAFARVMRTGVIRCGYYVFPPVTYRDPDTNALSGFRPVAIYRVREVKQQGVDRVNLLFFLPPPLLNTKGFQP